MSDFLALFVRFSFGLLCHALLLPIITNCRFGRRWCRLAWLGMFAPGSALVVPLILLILASCISQGLFAGSHYATALAFSILQVDVSLRLAVAGILCLLITSAYGVAARTLRLLGEHNALQNAESQLAAVLGNILENAWEATRKAQAPKLSVTAQPKGGSLLVEVENTLSGLSRFVGELPLTTKPAGGQGLKSVQRTLERRGGMLRCSRRGDTFYTQVVIPL